MYRSLVVILLLLMACQPRVSDRLVGTWQVDSVYQYYNGFDFSTGGGGDWPVYSYDDAGVLREIKGDKTRSYFYELVDNDTLLVSGAQGGEPTTYQVMMLQKDRMVLKLWRDPVFGSSTRAERYEVRYFSKIDQAADGTDDFSDPRDISN